MPLPSVITAARVAKRTGAVVLMGVGLVVASPVLVPYLILLNYTVHQAFKKGAQARARAEKERKQARLERGENDWTKILICGAENSGKSSLTNSWKPDRTIDASAAADRLAFALARVLLEAALMNEQMHSLLTSWEPAMDVSAVATLLITFVSFRQGVCKVWTEYELSHQWMLKRTLERCHMETPGHFFDLNHDEDINPNLAVLTTNYTSLATSLDEVIHIPSLTYGIEEHDFHLPQCGKMLSVVDCGGRRNQRRRWIHAFDDVDIVVFVASMVSFDMVSDGHPSINCMQESLQLFREMASSQWFVGRPMFLILTKMDVFQAKKARFEAWANGSEGKAILVPASSTTNETAESRIIRTFQSKARNRANLVTITTVANDIHSGRCVRDLIESFCLRVPVGLSPPAPPLIATNGDTTTTTNDADNNNALYTITPVRLGFNQDALVAFFGAVQAPATIAGAFVARASDLLLTRVSDFLVVGKRMEDGVYMI